MFKGFLMDFQYFECHLINFGYSKEAVRRKLFEGDYSKRTCPIRLFEGNVSEKTTRRTSPDRERSSMHPPSPTLRLPRFAVPMVTWILFGIPYGSL